MRKSSAETCWFQQALGGMSGAQGKAIELCQGVGIIAEVDVSKIELRMRLGWIKSMARTPEEAFALAKEYQEKKEPVSIAFHGNIVDLLEYAVETDQKIDLLTDQTSCHVAFDGGYCPQGLTFEERTKMLAENKPLFEEKVKKTLFRHHELIEILRSRGTYFFDYGNSLTTTMYDIGIREVCRNPEKMIWMDSSTNPLWKNSWGRPSSIMVTDPSAGLY